MLERLLSKYNEMSVQIKASIWFFICSFLQKAISAITTPIFTRLMTSQEFGEFNVFLSWQSILSIFLSLNLCYGLYTAGLVKYERDRVSFVTALQGLTITLICSWGSVYFCFHTFFNQLFSLSTTEMVCLIGTVWTTTVYCFWAAEERVNYNYKKLVFVTLLVSVIKPIVGITVVWVAEDKVTARIIGILVVEVIGFAWMFIAQVRRGGKFYSKTYWKYALVLGLPLIPHYLAQTVLNSSDRIMISRMINDSSAGIYSLAYSVAMIMNLFNTALNQSIGPWVYQKLKERKENEIEAVLLPTVYFVALVNLGLIAFAPEVIRFFAPVEYYEAIWTMPPVVMSVYYIYLYSLFSFAEFYYEKTSYIAAATVISAALNIVLNYFAINKFGYIAAGYTTLICFILYSIGHFCVMTSIQHRLLDGKRILSGKKLILISLFFTLCGFLISLTYNHQFIRYGIIMAALVMCIICRKRITDRIRMLVGIGNRFS